MPSLLCLSSGLTPQYRLDILRLLALPRGSEIQFRYGREIISESLREQLQWNLRANENAILAHVDCNESARPADGFCPITPCRHAVLIKSELLGSFYFLRFRLEEFAFWSHLEDFRKQLRGDIPRWTKRSEIVGRWCLEQSFRSETCRKIPNLDGWQGVIAQLAGRDDFANEPFFFAVEGIHPRGKSVAITPADGDILVRSEHNYVLQLFHFYPDGDHHLMSSIAGSIEVQVSAPYLESVTSPILPISSPYDLKDIYFRANATVSSRFGSIVVKALDSSGQPMASQPELFIPVKLKPARFKTMGFILLIALLLFAQQYVAAAAKGPVASDITILLVMLAIGTAAVAVLGLKKPL